VRPRIGGGTITRCRPSPYLCLSVYPVSRFVHVGLRNWRKRSDDTVARDKCNKRCCVLSQKDKGQGHDTTHKKLTLKRFVTSETSGVES